MDDEIREFYDTNSGGLFAFVYGQTLSTSTTRQLVELIWERALGNGVGQGELLRTSLYAKAREALLDVQEAQAAACEGEGVPGGSEVDAFLARLQPRYREVVSLKFDAELSNVEIAEVLGVSEPEVSLMLLQALRRLKVMLAQT
jgi:DNA-directed RNA polymerase specialized sigma24 family protein